MIEKLWPCENKSATRCNLIASKNKQFIQTFLQTFPSFFVRGSELVVVSFKSCTTLFCFYFDKQ